MHDMCYDMSTNKEDLCKRIKYAISSGMKFVILSGAGVSTNSGIPDYRSSHDRSLYNYFNNDSLSRDAFYEDPKYDDLIDMLSNCKPTTSHMLAKELHDRGLLLRVYTQNIDGLYQKTGLPNDMVVEFHGNAYDKTIVRNGDDIHNDTIWKLLDDFDTLDPMIILVMGTSLKVYPFACVPNLAPKHSIRVMIGYNACDFGPRASYHETGVSTHSQCIKFSYWKTIIMSDNPMCNKYKKVKRNVRGNVEWGWGNHTKKKKWKDYAMCEDVDLFSHYLLLMAIYDGNEIGQRDPSMTPINIPPSAFIATPPVASKSV